MIDNYTAKLDFVFLQYFGIIIHNYTAKTCYSVVINMKH